MANILKIGNRVLKIGGRILRGDSSSAPVDPYNPLGLPPFTIRCKFSSGYTPTQGDSQTLVDAGENIWDITSSGTDWEELFSYAELNLLEVLGANTTGVTNMRSMFSGCESLASVPLFDTSRVTDMSSMFSGCFYLTSVPLFDTSSCTDMGSMFSSCSSLTSVPLFDTSSVTAMSYMFYSCYDIRSIPLFDTSSVYSVDAMFYQCYSVQSGAFEIYQQMSTQANVPSHYQTFTECGNSENIPDDWKQPDDDGGDDDEEDYGDDEE